MRPELEDMRAEDIIEVGIKKADQAFRNPGLSDVDTFFHFGGAYNAGDSVGALGSEFRRSIVSVDVATC